MKQFRYAIIGAGSVGAYYGAQLARIGEEVHFVVRSDYAAIKKNGLFVSTTEGEFRINRPHLHRSPETLPECDVVLVALKTTQLDAAFDYLPRCLAPGGVVLTMQNGLGAEERVAQRIAAAQIWGAICFICAVRPSPGMVRQTDVDTIVIAPHQPGADNERVSLLIDRLKQASVDAQLEDDLARLRWRKLAWNIPYNGLCALLKKSTSFVLESQARQLAIDLTYEVMAGCKEVTGSPLPESLPQRLLSMTEQFDHYKPSMLIDREGGRPLELEAIFAEPLKQAKKAGVDMIRVEMLYKLLLAQTATTSASTGA